MGHHKFLSLENKIINKYSFTLLLFLIFFSLSACFNIFGEVTVKPFFVGVTIFYILQGLTVLKVGYFIKILSDK